MTLHSYQRIGSNIWLATCTVCHLIAPKSFFFLIIDGHVAVSHNLNTF